MSLENKRKGLVLIIVIGTLLVFSAVLFKPLDRTIRKYADGLKSKILTALETAFSVEIRYKSISPSLLRVLEIREFEISDKNHPASRLKIDSLGIRYQLFSLLKGETGEGIEEIILENANLELDENMVLDFYRRVLDRGTPPGMGERTPQLEKLPKILGKNINLTYRASWGTFYGKNVFFSLLPEKDSSLLHLTASIEFQGAEKFPFSSLSTKVEVTSRFRTPTEQTETVVTMESMQTDRFILEKQSFQLMTEGKKIHLRRLPDRIPLDLSIDYDGENIQARFLCEAFSPRIFFQFIGGSSPLNEWLRVSLSGSGEIAYRIPTRELEYSGTIDGVIKNEIIPIQTAFKGNFRGNNSRVRFRELYLRNPYGALTFSGTVSLKDFIPEGSFVAKDIRYRTSYPINGSGRLSRIPDGLRIEGNHLTWGAAEFSNYSMDLHVIPAFRRFEVQFSLGEGYTPVHGYGIVPEGNLQNVVWGVTLEDLPLRLITPLINQLGGEGRAEYLEKIPPIRISTQLYGEFSSQTRIVDVPAFTIQEESELQNRVKGSFRYENGSFGFPVLDFQWKGYGGTAVVQGKQAGGGTVEFDMDLALEDIRYRFHAFIDPKGYVRITGSNDSKLELHWGKNTGMFGSLSLQDLPLNFIAPEVRVTCKADFFYESRDRWVLDIGILQTHSILLPSGEKAEVSLSGTILPGQGSLQFLRFKDSISDLQGNGSAFFSMDGTMIQIRVFLEDTRKNERYTLVCSWDQGSGSAELELTNSPLVRFFPGHGIEGKAEGHIRISDIFQSPRIMADLHVEEGTYKESPFTLRFSGTLTQELIQVDTLNVTYADFQIRKGKGVFDLQTGLLTLELNSSIPIAGTPSEWSVNGNLQFQGPLSLSELSTGYIPFVQGSCSVSIHDNWVPAEFKNWNIEAIKSGTLFLISGGPENAIQGAIDSKGTFSLQVGSPIPMTFDVSGSFTRESSFKLSIQNIRFSLSLVRKYLDFGVFRITDGWVSGFLRIEGPIQDPDFFGELSVVEGKARLDLVPEELGPFSGVLAFQEKECSFQPITLHTQGGTVQVSGLLEIEQWIPSRGKVWIDTGPKGGVRIDSNFGGVLIQGIGRGKVEITILDQEVQVTGKILATNTGITLGEIPSEEEPSSDQGGRLVVDLEVESDKSVEFLWPSESFPIIRTYAALGQTLRIKLDTLQGSSLIQGDISIRGGQIYYFDRVFYLREGRIVFNERGDAFDPIISARAEIRENTEIGLVRIYLIADNTRLSQFSPRFESDPTLSQLELFSILGANTLSLGTHEAVNLSSALLFSNDIFLQTEIIQAFEKNMRNRFNLDMFSVRTHIFQNVLTGLITPPENLSQNQTIPSLGRYLDKTSVFLGKYIGSDLFLEYLIQLRAQDPFTSDVRRFGGIGIESEIIVEWKTPFFILEWSLRPKEPEELFILDNIIAFRWRYTY